MPRLDLKGDSRARKKIGKAFESLVALQARLRSPNGCPWDREQTHDSLRTYLVEETYEVLDALDSGDPRKFADELGDLLLQIVFHSELAAEAGKFDIADVIEQIYTKMVRRHPHVFGSVRADTSAEVLKNWEQLKSEERATEQRASEQRTNEQRPNGTQNATKKDAQAAAKAAKASILDAVPRSLPALLEAHQLTRRAANVGFDWPEVNGIFEKLTEEAGELKQLLVPGESRSQGAKSPRRGEIEEEVGDLLFVGVNLARFLGFDAEIALKKANRKFAGRFREMERIAASRGQALSGLSTAELDSLWNEVKGGNAQKMAGKQGGPSRKTLA
jgi:MazG family protein